MIKIVYYYIFGKLNSNNNYENGSYNRECDDRGRRKQI